TARGNSTATTRCRTTSKIAASPPASSTRTSRRPNARMSTWKPKPPRRATKRKRATSPPPAPSRVPPRAGKGRSDELDRAPARRRPPPRGRPRARVRTPAPPAGPHLHRGAHRGVRGVGRAHGHRRHLRPAGAQRPLVGRARGDRPRRRPALGARARGLLVRDPWGVAVLPRPRYRRRPRRRAADDLPPRVSRARRGGRECLHLRGSVQYLRRIRDPARGELRAPHPRRHG